MSAPPTQYSFPVRGAGKPGEGPTHRSVLAVAPSLGVVSENGVCCMTCYDIFQNARIQYPSRPFLGHRPINPKGEAGEYVWETYAQVGARVDKFGSGLQALNCIPSCGDPVLDNKGLLGIYSRNVPEWIVAEQACYAFGALPVPMYDTYSPDEVAYTINMCKLTTLVVHEVKLEAALSAKGLAGTETLTTIIVIGNIPPAAVTAASAKGLTCYGFGDVEAKGTLGASHCAPQSKDVMTFCFTSGTTGDAKGALLTHENMISDLAGCIPLVDASVPVPLEFCKEVHCSYLPLPHVFERLNFQVMAHYGGCVGFYQGDPLKLVDDLLHLHPTVFASVPPC
jgi:long-chain acyl-CoA synthetase